MNPPAQPGQPATVRNAFWQGLDDTHKVYNRHDVWLRRSGQWHGGRFGIDWRPEKVLGQGAGVRCVLVVQ